MSAIMELAKQRYTCRKYAERAVDPALVEQCLQIAALAPSARNSQPWLFYVVEDEAKRRRVAELMAAMGKNGWADPAPVMIGIVQDSRTDPELARKYAHGDIGIVTAYLTLAATQLGLNSSILGGFPNEEVKQVLGVPEEDKLRLLVLLGYSAEDSVPEKQRKSLTELIRRV